MSSRAPRKPSLRPSAHPDHGAAGDQVGVDAGTRARSWVEGRRRWVARGERTIWAVVLAVFLADLGLTLFGFYLGLDESNPLAIWLLARYGLAGIVGLKLGVLGMALAFRQVLPDRYSVVVPLALVVPWGYAVLVNLFVIGMTV